MSAADIAMWIWLLPVLLCFTLMFAILAGLAVVGIDSMWRRWRDLPRWGRTTVARRWWRRNRATVLAAIAAVVWGVGGYLVVAYLNGASA